MEVHDDLSPIPSIPGGGARPGLAGGGVGDFLRFPRHLGAGLYDQITALCRDSGGFEPRVAQEATQMQTIVGLVAARCGVSIVPRSVAALTGLGAVFAELVPATPPVELALAVPLRGVSPVVTNFVAVARDVTRVPETG